MAYSRRLAPPPAGAPSGTTLCLMTEKLEGQVQARVRSFGYALRGLGDLVTSQPNVHLHLAATVAVVAAGVALGLSRLEWGLIVVVLAVVWLAEALNTALEHACDACHPTHHPRIARAKDVAAAAVLLAALAATVLGLLVFAPHLTGSG